MTSENENIKATLHKHRHLLIPFGIPLGLLALVYFIYLNGALNRVDELKFLMEEKTASIENMRKLLKQEKNFHKDIERSQQEIDKYKKNLHSEGAGEKLVKDVLGLAKSKSLSITALEAENPVIGAFFNEMSLKINVEGAFPNQLSFVRLLESQTPPYKVSGISMRSDEKGTLRTSFLLKAFVRHEKK